MIDEKIYWAIWCPDEGEGISGWFPIALAPALYRTRRAAINDFARPGCWNALYRAGYRCRKVRLQLA